jgi:hypothetical protein
LDGGDAGGEGDEKMRLILVMTEKFRVVRRIFCSRSIRKRIISGHAIIQSNI